MHWALLYRASPPVDDEEADERVAELTRALSRRGWVPRAVQRRGDGGHLSVLCEGAGEAPRIDVAGLEFVLATEVAYSRDRPDPPLVQPDPTTVDPRPTPFDEVRVRGERELDVVFGRGVIQRLHSVAVDERADEVVVTVHVGTVRGLPERMFVTLQRLIETARVTLETPLGGRPVRDGAGPEPAERDRPR